LKSALPAMRSKEFKVLTCFDYSIIMPNYKTSRPALSIPTFAWPRFSLSAVALCLARDSADWALGKPSRHGTGVWVPDMCLTRNGNPTCTKNCAPVPLSLGKSPSPTSNAGEGLPFTLRRGKGLLKDRLPIHTLSDKAGLTFGNLRSDLSVDQEA
jgi:hypothetical protein